MIDKDVDDIYNGDYTLVSNAEIFISNEVVSTGYWKVNPQFWIYTPHKPNMVSRFFTKLLLGWEWVDTNKK